MPSDIRTVLLVPADGDPLGLLAGGACGARPPVVRHLRDVGWTHLPTDSARWPVTAGPALVMKWAGRKHRDGCNRAADILEDRGWSTSFGPKEPHEYRAADLTAEALAMYCAEMEVGRVILLDSDNNEVTDAR